MNLIENRHIRVFLSSTFRDMQDERDYLMKRTFPQLRRIALERDVTLTELDLRWGITKEESESGKVVEICLREIENSIPFFIGIIGNRYGWVPEAKDLGDNVTIQFPSVKDYLSERLSVTEMEMQFGVLERQEDMHAFFFIKESDENKSDNPEMLERLKKSVINNNRYPVEYYSSAEELAQKVHRAFTNLIDNLYGEKNLLPEEKFRLAQKSFLNSLCKGYIRNDTYFNRISLWCDNPRERIYAITGESGLGKSALIANWVNEKETDTLCAFNIAYSFVGIGGNEGALDPIVKDLSAQIIELYHLERNHGEDSLKSLFELVSCQPKPLVIVIDAVNQLVDIEDAKLMNWIPEVPKNIKLIVSTLANDKSYDTLVNIRHCTSLTISPLNLVQRHLLIQEYISQFGKKLTDSQYNNILSYRQTANTLVLKTLLDEIITYGDYCSLDQKITSLLCSNSIEGFYDAIIESYENVFGPIVKDILSLIAVSKRGLSESEIITILGLTPLVWSQFYCSFGRHLQASNGLLFYSHINIKLAVSARYSLDRKNEAAVYRKRILSYFKGAGANRDREEIAFQLYKLNHRKKLYRFLSDEDVFEYLYDEDPSSLRTYWKSLNSLNPDIKDFCQTIDKLEEADDRHRIYSKLSYFCREDLTCIEDSVYFGKKTLENAATKEMQADSFSYLALAYEAIGDYYEALSYHKKAYNIREQLFGPDNPDTASSLHGIGSAYESLGKYRLALRYLKRALRIWEQHFGLVHDNTATCYNSIGVTYSNAGQHKTAILYGKKALKSRLQLYGRSHYDVAASYNRGCRELLKIS